MVAADAAEEDARRQAELAKAYATYQDLMAAAGCIDFGDQVSLALRLVRTSPAARREIASRFRYILVDEFQDTNRAQAELVAALAEEHRNVTVVGDDDQAIYAFRGAAVDNILAFQDRYLGAGPSSCAGTIARSRRSSMRRTSSVQRSRTASRSGTGSSSDSVLSAPPVGVPVRLEVFGTGAEEADWIAADIDAGSRREHRRAIMPILVRANGHADPILQALNMAGIPWRFSGTSGLYARPEVRLLLSFLRVAADLDSSVDLYAVAARTSIDSGART